MSRLGDGGQAAVEAALTLPLTLFLILGTLQLFMLLQARVLAHYAVARATRAGSVDHASCVTMSQVALAALLPSFARTDSPAALAEAYRRRNTGRFDATFDAGRTEDIFWLTRLGPAGPDANEEEDFDLQGRTDVQGRNAERSLEMELVFWYPLRIPFANQVIAMLTVAQYGLANVQGANPLMATQRRPDWRGSRTGPRAQGGDVAGELLTRTTAGHYALPIKATYAMRMMTPVRGIARPCTLPIGSVP